jgi:hypothetical protein
MGQGFFGYNPPPFVIDAAKKALDQVDCNQYSPTKVGLLNEAEDVRFSDKRLGTTAITEGLG